MPTLTRERTAPAGATFCRSLSSRSRRTPLYVADRDDGSSASQLPRQLVSRISWPHNWALLSSPPQNAWLYSGPPRASLPGILIALGPWARVPVAIGVIAASLAANLMADRSVWSALAFGLCNAGEALVVMWLIERWFGPAFNLDSLRRVLGFFAAAAVATATAALGAPVQCSSSALRQRHFSTCGRSGSRLTRSAS